MYQGKMTRSKQRRLSRKAQRYSGEFDEYGNEYGPLPEHLRRCRKCEDNVHEAARTLRQNGYDLSKLARVSHGQQVHRWTRVRNVTVEEHGISKPYKGVYKCNVCEYEKVADNSPFKERKVVKVSL